MKAPIVAFHEALASIRTLSLRHTKVGSGQAWCHDENEIVRVNDEHHVEVRLGRRAVKRRRPELESDPRVVLPEPASDWLTVKLESADDALFAADLVRSALG